MHSNNILYTIAALLAAVTPVNAYVGVGRMPLPGLSNPKQAFVTAKPAPQAPATTVYDLDRIERGQKFFMENMTPITTSWLFALGAGFALPDLSTALLHTRGSDTPSRARQRYIQTSRDLLSWNTMNFFDPNSSAYKRLRAVKAMHCGAAQSLATKTPPAKCPFSRIAKIVQKDSETDTYNFQQRQLAMTQNSFVEKLGIAEMSGIEDYVYLWYVIGRELGIDDEHNTCTSADKARSVAMGIRADMKPVLERAHLDRSYEALAGALVGGYNELFPKPFQMSINHLFHGALELLQLESAVPSQADQADRVKLAAMFSCH